MKKISFKIYALVFLFIAGCSFTPVSEEAIKKPDQNERAISVLNNLIQVDIDMYHAYNQAIQAVRSSKHIQTLKDFRSEHERHAELLSKMVLTRGGIPPEFSRDFKGYLISGYTAIRAKGSLRSILQAMETNETLAVKYHNDALKIDLPMDVRNTIHAHLKAEENYLASIKKMKRQP